MAAPIIAIGEIDPAVSQNTAGVNSGVLPSVILHGAALALLMVGIAGGRQVEAPQATMVSLVAPVAPITAAPITAAPNTAAQTTAATITQASASRSFTPMPHPPTYQPPRPEPAAAPEEAATPAPEPDAIAIQKAKPKPKEKPKPAAKPAQAKPTQAKPASKPTPQPQSPPASQPPSSQPPSSAVPAVAAASTAAARTSSAAQTSAATGAGAANARATNVNVAAMPSDEPVLITDPGYAGTCQIDYPARAQRRNQQGTVVIRALIGIDGRPTEVLVKTSSGFRQLDEAAKEAIADCAFKPQMVGGRPVRAIVEIPIPFKLI